MPKISGGRDAVKKIIAKAEGEGRKALTEAEGKQIFKAYGVPIPGEASVKTAEEAVKESSKIGYPVVMKILSPDMAHKTDVGGVVAASRTMGAKAAFDRLASCKKAKPGGEAGRRLDPADGLREEVILSMIDVQFGPVGFLRSGRNIRRDTGEISSHATMTEETDGRHGQLTKSYRLLSARERRTIDIDAIKDAIRRIALIALETPRSTSWRSTRSSSERGKGCWAVDALCTLN